MVHVAPCTGTWLRRDRVTITVGDDDELKRLVHAQENARLYSSVPLEGRKLRSSRRALTMIPSRAGPLLGEKGRGLAVSGVVMSAACHSLDFQKIGQHSLGFEKDLDAKHTTTFISSKCRIWIILI